MKVKTVNFNYADFEPIKNIALTFPGSEESTLHEQHLELKFVENSFHLADNFKTYPYILCGPMIITKCY